MSTYIPYPPYPSPCTYFRFLLVALSLLSLSSLAFAETAQGQVRTEASLVGRLTTEGKLTERNSSSLTNDTILAEETVPIPSPTTRSRKWRSSKTTTTPTPSIASRSDIASSIIDDAVIPQTTLAVDTPEINIPIIIFPTFTIPTSQSDTPPPDSESADSSKALHDPPTFAHNPKKIGILAGLLTTSTILLIALSICFILFRRRRRSFPILQSKHTPYPDDVDAYDSDTRRLTMDRDSSATNSSLCPPVNASLPLTYTPTKGRDMVMVPPRLVIDSVGVTPPPVAASPTTPT
ncbi:hypothetical protein HK097_004750, partial [Rhizophlyctis rosea]